MRCILLVESFEELQKLFRIEDDENAPFYAFPEEGRYVVCINGLADHIEIIHALSDLMTLICPKRTKEIEIIQPLIPEPKPRITIIRNDP